MSELLLDLSVEDKSFHTHRVIDNVGFKIRSGEAVSLVGPSGCGKSTLLRIVAGLDAAYTGAVKVRGKAPQLHSPDVGFIFQEPRLLPWLTVAENVGFEIGSRAARKDERVHQLLAEVGLENAAKAYPKQLSGGMAQRAAIARGLFTQPSLLLLDEPFSAVDAFTRIRLQELLLSLAAKHGTTLLLVTHDIDEAVYLSDRVVVLGSNPGRVRGEVRVGLTRPRDRRNPVLTERANQVFDLLEPGRNPRNAQTPQAAAEEAASIPAQPPEPVRFAFAI